MGKMKKNIVLIGARLSDNFGGPSLAVSTVEVLIRAYPDSGFTLLVPEKAYEKDKSLESKYSVTVLPFHADKVVLFSLIKRCIRLSIGSVPFQKTITALEDADFIVDIWGIMFADSFRSVSFIPKLREGLRLILGRLFKKPFVKYTSAMGPFQAKWNRVFAKYYLNKYVNVILARDIVTKDHLKTLGIRTPVFVAPDTAFLLLKTPIDFPAHLSGFFQQRKILGISVSYQTRNRFGEPNQYISMITSFIRYVVQNYDISVLLIPNDLDQGMNDDNKIVQEIESTVARDECKILNTSNLTASEIKGMISHCELLIASRYHTVVAGLSLGIPTIAVGWHHKYIGVLQLFNQHQWVLDIKNVNLEILKTQFAALWEDQGSIRKEIQSYIPQVKQDIFSGVENFSKLL